MVFSPPMTLTLAPVDPASPALARRYAANRTALAAVTGVLAKLDASTSPPPLLLADAAAPEVVLNFAINNSAFYAVDPRALADQHVAGFAEADQSFKPGISAYVPEDEVAYQRILALDAAFGTPLMAQPRPYTVTPGYAPLLTVLGIGLGWHLEPLLSRYDPSHLVLFESDAEILRASLHAIDWRPIVERFAKDGRSLTIVVEAEPQAGLDGLLAALQRPNPALIVGSRYFRLYQSPYMDLIADNVSQRLPLLGYGWGYFKDERRQILQTAENIRKPRRWLRHRWPALAGGDAVVVGAGPSLDKSLDLLTRIRDRVIIFAGGSAIRPLARAGMEPDFHIELETAPATTAILRELPDQSLFERITLLASNGMVPDALDIFRTAHLFVRENSVSSRLMGNTVETVPGCYPIVGNAAVGIAATLGFRRITLLGVDFGYRDPNRHHASGTIYIDDASNTARKDLADIGLAEVALLDYRDTRHTLPSILGDTLLADDTFHMSHVAMEIFLAGWPDLSLIQCGEGARLHRATNLRPDQLALDSYRGSRIETLAALRERFEPPPLDADSYGLRMAGLAETVAKISLQLKELFGRPLTDTAAYAHAVSEAHALLHRGTRDVPAGYEMLYGILTSYFKATIERSFMAASADERRRFVDLARQHFLLLLDDIAVALEPLRRLAERSS